MEPIRDVQGTLLAYKGTAIDVQGNTVSETYGETDVQGNFIASTVDVGRFDVQGNLMLLNSEPTDITLSVSTIVENSPIGTVVGVFSTTDPDAGNTFTYTLVTGTSSTDNASFEIVGANLKTLVVFDYEAA
jgi:hypothetical protein